MSAAKPGHESQTNSRNKKYGSAKYWLLPLFFRLNLSSRQAWLPARPA